MANDTAALEFSEKPPVLLFHHYFFLTFGVFDCITFFVYSFQDGFCLFPTIQLRKFVKLPVPISRSTHFTILLYDTLQMLAVAFKVDLESLL